ncbi:MAG TPA: hypothetical protein VF191_01250 [Cyclobacteriaceae bacterium]
MRIVLGKYADGDAGQLWKKMKSWSPSSPLVHSERSDDNLVMGSFPYPCLTGHRFLQTI